LPRDRQSISVRRFNDLIPFRVHEVLLVSSPYDAFILQEDGHLTERMFFEYREISLSSAPRFTHATNGEEAIALLKSRRFDLVVTMTSLADSDIIEFSRRVKELSPGMPVVVLALDRVEVSRLEETGGLGELDGAFVWNGDLSILLAVIKTVEDRKNVDHDVALGNVRVILMIEDSPQYYSALLAVLYRELMRQSLSLYAEGLSEIYRKMYTMSRPKVLHARSYEAGVEMLERYRQNVLAVICDIRIPRGGQPDPKGGLDFARFARSYDPDLPLLLQSAEAQNREEANSLGAAFLDKNSPSLLAEIEEFLSLRLGFGDFIFRTSDGREFDRARDLRELEEKLASIPDDVLEYHAVRNDISIWLMARSEFELAEELRPQRVSDYPDLSACRSTLVTALRDNRERVHRGVVSDFSSDHFESDIFSRFGGGYLGGKARGIAFLHQTLSDLEPGEFPTLAVRIPQSIVIATDEFDSFLENNGLRDFAVECDDDREIRRRFLRGRLSESLISMLEKVADRFDCPLAVRSSSLLEDSMHRPFAGIYSTLMVPNQAADPMERLRELSWAVKLVYASTFSENAKSFLAATGSRIEEEKMAVILQRVVGRQFQRRFYPHFSGLVQSRNYYPIGPQKSEDGIAHVALGLGRQIVDGGMALRFSPKHPQVMPQFSNLDLLLDHSQRGFWALDLDRALPEAEVDLYSTLRYCDLDVAEKDGTLSFIASVASVSDGYLKDDLRSPGPRVLTFNNILKHKAIPLARTLTRILQITERGLACPVEVEFACDLGDLGRSKGPGRSRHDPRLYLLQVRPLGNLWDAESEVSADFPRGELLCFSQGSLGHGVIRDVRDVVYVRPDRWEPSANRAIAQEIGQLNHSLKAESRGYILIGPGRWGTADEWLGIPVQWAQISSAKVIIEASPPGYEVDPSQGTHFFHNITSQGIGYLTVPPGADGDETHPEYFLDGAWLDAQAAVAETEHLRHLRFEQPLRVVLNGRDGTARIGKP